MNDRLVIAWPAGIQKCFEKIKKLNKNKQE